MKYKLVIFDLDGTLLYTIEDIADSLNYALRYFGYQEVSLEKVTSCVGNGAKQLVRRVINDDNKIDIVTDYYVNYYREHCDIKTKEYPNISDLLAELKENGYLLAVVSNKVDKEVKSLINKHFPNIFDVVVGEQKGIRKKPYPDSIHMILEKLNIDKKDMVYIGDSEVDIQTCLNGNFNLICVSYGYRDRKSLENSGGKIIVDKVEDIIKHL